MNRLTRGAVVTAVLCGLGSTEACDKSSSSAGEVASPGEVVGSTAPQGAPGTQTGSPQTTPSALAAPAPATSVIPATGNDPAPQGATGACAPDFVTKGNALIAQYLEKSKAPGIAVAFYDNGKACFFSGGNSVGRNTGKITPDTIFAMGSVQKVFTTTMLAYEIVQGHASIDDLASKYLVSADGSTVSPRAAFSKVTLRNLVTHSASLPEGPPNAGEPVGWSYWRDKPMPPALMTFLNSWEPPYPIGTKYKYSNMGFVLAGHAATKMSKKSASAGLAEAVTEPIGMAHTARAICDSPNPLCTEAREANGRPAGGAGPVGLWTTARDMGRFVEAELGAIQLPDLQARAVALTHQELFRADTNHAVGMAWEIWHSGDALMLSKNGEDSGFTSWIAFLPAKHRGVALLSSGPGLPVPATIGMQLFALAAGE